MIRARSEAITFNRDDLEKVARHMAQTQIATQLRRQVRRAVARYAGRQHRGDHTYVQGDFEELPR
jgi:hypothetical protein